MILRIQSLYLLLGALALVVLLMMGGDLWSRASTESVTWLPVALMGLGGFTAAGALLAVFAARDPRHPHKMLPGLQRQRKVVVGIQLLTVAFLLVLFVGLYMAGTLPLLSDLSGMGVLALPVVAYGFFFMARRGIDRDIRQLRQADSFRLRD